MWNPYDDMKAKVKKNYNNSLHFNNLYNTLASMFTYTGLPNTLRPEYIENMFISQGHCGVFEHEGNLYTGPGSFTGEVFNFMPTRYLITVVGLSSADFEGEIGKDCAVGWNNATITPDLALWQYSSILSEIDVSERVNLLFTRFLRIPKVKDSKEKIAIEDAIKTIMAGQFTAVISDGIQNLLETDPDASEKFLDLVDIKEVDKIQYLNQYRDNVVKRFFQMYGQGMQSTAKLAQQTTDELHGNDGVSMIIPIQRLAYRKKFVEDINRLFGTSITVDFSECWKESQQEMHEDDVNSVDDREQTEPTDPEGVENDETDNNTDN